MPLRSSRGGEPEADCLECAAMGATRSESAALHAGAASRADEGGREITRTTEYGVPGMIGTLTGDRVW